MDFSNYRNAIVAHYELAWGQPFAELHWDAGPRSDLPPEFAILAFSPRRVRSMWTYATVCMSLPDDLHKIELHLFAPESDGLHVELLTAIAHYHRTESALSLGDILNFGRPWLPDSLCSHGLISLPYLDGPDLELLETATGIVNCYWLIPVTPRERAYMKQEGREALERKFQEQSVNYLDPVRDSVV